MDPELDAMKEIYTALKDLDNKAKHRVIQWIVGRFSLNLSMDVDLKSERHQEGGLAPKFEIPSFASVAEIFSKACPKIDAEKVLVVATHLQRMEMKSELTAREINMHLRQLGHRVRNITSTIGALINRKPQLMIQTRKEGKTKQAQKKYRVTDEGLAAVERMINQDE